MKNINSKRENLSNKMVNNKNLLILNVVLFIVVVILFFCRNIYNFDYILAAVVLLMLLSLLIYKPSIYVKYFFSTFYCVFMLIGVFICNNTNLYLTELLKNAGYNGSFGLAIVYNVVFLVSLVCFDHFFSKKFNYYLAENEIIKNKITNIVIYVFMFLFGLGLFLLVCKNPSFLLKVDRFRYKENYLPAIVSKFQKIYVYFVPFLLLPIIVGKEKINFKWLLKVCLTLFPFLLYGFWTGNKFGIYLNVIILLLSPLIVVMMKEKIQFNEKENLLISSNQEKKARRKICRMLPIICILFLIVLVPYYLFRGSNVKNSLLSRTAQQGQLWWATFGIEENSSYHLDELSDEINPLLESFLGEPITKSYGIYKIMNLTTPAAKVSAKLSTGSRYSAQGIEIAFYYFKYSGLILHAVLRGLIEAVLVCLLVKYVFSYRLVEICIIGRLILIKHSIFTQGDLYMLFSKTTILSIILLVILEILFRMYMKKQKYIEKQIDLLYNKFAKGKKDYEKNKTLFNSRNGS